MGNCKYTPLARVDSGSLFPLNSNSCYDHAVGLSITQVCNLPTVLTTNSYVCDISSCASGKVLFRTEKLTVHDHTLVFPPRDPFVIDSKLHPKIKIEIHAVLTLTGLRTLVGQTVVGLDQLVRKAEWDLYLFDEFQVLVYDRPARPQPLFCSLSVRGVRAPEPRAEASKPLKRIVIITRGTRGDVQPFMALARGLAEHKNWSVTVVTELAFYSLVKAHSKTSRGEIHFRPSGGDTESSFDWPMAKWMMNQRQSIFQLIMLARAERVFFESEPAFSYFARQAQADLLLFGFNTATMAQILGEALQIPICGFLLQPTVIPSQQYPSIVSILDPSTKPIDNITTLEDEEDGKRFGYLPSEQFAKFLKTQWENNIFTRRLDQMRILNGLQPHSMTASTSSLRIMSFGGDQARAKNVFDALQEDCTTMLCPINEFAFGGKPRDWSENVNFTDFIFTSPLSETPEESLAKDNAELAQFIRKAKLASKPVIAITFSSMPVERNTIIELSVKVLNGSKSDVRIVCVVGARLHKQSAKPKLEREFAKFKAEHRIMEVPVAPFTHLFPLCDFLILHGGLGTTSEALRAGRPCLVTGFLLFDQRFWGKRIFDMGCGPAPVHIRDLGVEIVGAVDEALRPGNTWGENARKVADKLRESGHGDGLQVNVDAVAACLAEDYPPATSAAVKRQGSFRGEEEEADKPVQPVQPEMREMGEEDEDDSREDEDEDDSGEDRATRSPEI